MMFMNRSEIADLRDRTCYGSVRWKAARVLDHLVLQADLVSDGWAYWPKPARAAAKMMALAQVRISGPNVTEGDYRKALSPIKAFYTKWGLKAGMAPIPEHLL